MIGDDIELYQGSTGTLTIWHDTDLVLTTTRTLRASGEQTQAIDWGPIVNGPKSAKYAVDCRGVLTGALDSRELAPVHFLKASQVKFADGRPIPSFKLPQKVKDTFSDLSESLKDQLRSCTASNKMSDAGEMEL